MDSMDIPESLQFYYQSGGNAQAIELLVNKINAGDDEATDDMGWEDLSIYHRALLAAYQTRVDLWLFYKTLWEGIWAPAIAELSAPAPAECEPHEYEGELSLSKVWEEGIFRVHRLGRGTFTSLVNSDDKAIWIAFYYEDSSGSFDISNRLVLDSTIWEADPEEDTRVTDTSATNVRGLSRVDISQLRDAAHAALTAFKQAYAGFE